ncbi:hypothetical protein HNR46_001605 [Haloferula luteola]|uniref:Uncharacterized protein n=1 Tax=Haloferula luteola TaxID=595692 RepID=A0A840VC31_9BACT|nr:hypothetical protein [Haloferula luteola]MBB5351369.1 hypothetical protein [Haloferula luteola]
MSDRKNISGARKTGTESRLRTSGDPVLCLSEIIKLTGVAISRAAEICGFEESTFRKWFSGRRSPAKATVLAAIHSLESSDYMRIRLEEVHHIKRKPSGLYQMRATIDRGPKLVGVRITQGLGTRDLREALERRDLIIAALEKAERISNG